jgi:hypothetical protein
METEVRVQGSEVKRVEGSDYRRYRIWYREDSEFGESRVVSD